MLHSILQIAQNILNIHRNLKHRLKVLLLKRQAFFHWSQAIVVKCTILVRANGYNFPNFWLRGLIVQYLILEKQELSTVLEVGMEKMQATKLSISTLENTFKTSSPQSQMKIRKLSFKISDGWICDWNQILLRKYSTSASLLSKIAWFYLEVRLLSMETNRINAIFSLVKTQKIQKQN